ncbi:MAG: hypothetical protein WAV15_02400 [Minisyncoccia bacterium]
MRKILPYILIVLIFVGAGFFGTTEKGKAEEYKGTCYDIGTRGFFNGTDFARKFEDVASADCNYEQMVKKDSAVKEKDNFVWQSTKEPTAAAQGALDAAANQNQFQAAVNELDCGGIDFDIWPGCVVKIFYYLLYVLPAYILVQTAYFFNVLISVTLSSSLFTHPFVAEAWGVVRDLSNIFFILILLYVAIKIILGLGGHGVKQMIAKVVVVALLINFSMFFTGVVIDASNMLALVFYNKLQVNTKVGAQPRQYASVGGERDVAGGMVAAFDPTTTMKEDFFIQVRQNYGPNNEPLAPSPKVPWGTLLALILFAGLIICFAIYALFISGLSFLGRLIELWILIIFSPFAFMSSTIPLLGHAEYIGWDAWLKRLLKTAFMAPIFMFFLYFIFMLIKSDIFTSLAPKGSGTNDPATVMKMILGVAIPTLLILILLLKATQYAKKGSGAVGEVITKVGGQVGGMAAGIALGAATGGASMALRGTVGRAGANLAESNAMRNWAAKSSIGKTVLRASSGLADRSFDLRKAPGMESLAKGAGINLGAAKAMGLGPKDGFTKNREAAVKAQEEFANKMLDTSDYGKADLSRGGKGKRRAKKLKELMIAGGMDADKAEGYMKDLRGNGIEKKNLGDVAKSINSARRNLYADRLEKRKAGWTSKAGVRNARKRIAANKIRKDVATQKHEEDMDHVIHKMHEMMEKAEGGGEKKHAKKHEKKEEEHGEEEHGEDAHGDEHA